MSIVIHQSISSVAPQATAAPIALQSGSVVSARVLQVVGDAAQIAINGYAIDVVSQVPLQAGQTLQLAVSQTADSIQLAVVDQQPAAAAQTASPSQSQSQSPSTSPSNAPITADTVSLTPAAIASLPLKPTQAAAPAVQLTPQEVLAVQVAAQNAATQQAGLAPLFANLDVAAGSNNLPPQVQQAISQVLSHQVSLDQTLTGGAIQQAFQSSGLFLEASLAAGSAPASAGVSDLKAALLVLRQALTTALSATTAQTPAELPAAPGGAQPTAVAPQSPPSVATVPSAVVVVVVSAAARPGSPAEPTALPQPAATAPQAAGQAEAPIASAIVVEQGAEPIVQATLQALPQASATTSLPQAQPSASPPLVPLPASEIAAPEVLLAAAPTALEQNGPTLGMLSETPAAASMATAAEAQLAAASGAALTLLQEALQAEPLVAGFAPQLLFNNATMLSLLPAAAGAHTLKEDDADAMRSFMPPPPISGGVPAAQPVVAATLVTNSPGETAMHHLLAETEGAIARQVLLQVASLPQQVDASGLRLDAGALRWNFEIPFATAQGTAMAQFEIARDGGGGSKAEGPKPVWRARFSLDVEPAGPVHALITLNGERTAVRMWAERPATAAQLRAGAGELSRALSSAELKVGDIVIRDGAAPEPAPARAGHFLDRAL